MPASKPVEKPATPNFSSGPCAKRPGWTAEAVAARALLGRSHRSAAAKAQMVDICERSRRLLGIPADYKIAILAGSDTAAMECAMWSMLGARPVDVFAWDVFGREWMVDIEQHLKLKDQRRFWGEFGTLPDLSQANPDHDIVFTWHGTTAGVRVPNADWISDSRTGLVFCDSISAIFAMEIPLEKMDVITWSWQKGMGGEAQHGMIALSPRAIERLQTYIPAWPLPKIFRMATNGKLNDMLFEGDTLNTPSMLCVADAEDALAWMEENGGLDFLIERTNRNAAIMWNWIETTPWVDFLARDPATRSTTAHCFRFTAPEIIALDEPAQRAFVRRIAALLEAEEAAFDIAGHRDAPPCLRVWTGPTVEASDVEKLLPWLEWAYEIAKGELAA